MRYLLLWLVALVIGQLLSWLAAAGASIELQVGLGLAIGVAFGLIFTKNQRDQGRALEAARLGDRARCEALLQKRRKSSFTREMDIFGTAALEIIVGDRISAFTRIQAAQGTIGLAGKMRKLIESHLALANGDPSRYGHAVATLLDMGTMFLFHRQAERYRVYLLGLAALLPLPPSDLSRLDRELATHKDPEARAYLQWARAAHEVAPFNASDRLADMRRGVELAGIHGLAALAAKVSARATAFEVEASGMGPYRR